ncbi:unknown [Prevotella sp. CAG:732]|nr:unknown [Prevotella sp. CAG:732]
MTGVLSFPGAAYLCLYIMQTFALYIHLICIN